MEHALYRLSTLESKLQDSCLAIRRLENDDRRLSTTVKRQQKLMAALQGTAEERGAHISGLGQRLESAESQLARHYEHDGDGHDSEDARTKGTYECIWGAELTACSLGPSGFVSRPLMDVP